jgi:hypothetical protein
MRILQWTLLSFLFINVASGQVATTFTLHPHYTPDQLQILKLEGEECMALAKRDSATLEKLWGKELNYKCEAGTTGDFYACEYLSISRESKFLAEVSRNKFMSIGKEIIVRLTGGPDSGSTIERKYTHIWSKQEGKWQLIAKYIYDSAQ